MRIAVAVAAVLLGVAPSAEADAPRGAQLTVLGGFVVGELDDAAETEPEVGGLVGAALAWDRAPPAYPVVPGYALRGDLVPELTVARLGETGALLAGARLEVDFAQREMGLLRVSARGSMYVAPRIGVVRGADGPAVGVDVGAAYALGGSGWSLGYGLGLLGWEEAPDDVIQGDDELVAQIVPPPGGWPAERVLVLTGYLTLSSRL